MSRNRIRSFYRRRYVPPSIVVAAAGSLDHGLVVRRVRDAFAGLGDGQAQPAPYRSSTGTVPVLAAQTVVHTKETEQAHLVLGGPGLRRSDERRFALNVLNNVLGGGMSSRLFQEIREKRGLAYSVYSYTTQFADAGMYGVYAGCAPGKVEEVLDIARTELARVAADGITDEEVARGKGMLKGSVVLGLEDTGSRMSRLGKGELLHDELLSVDGLLAKVDAVTPDEVRAIAAELLVQPQSLAVVGPFDQADFPTPGAV